jgi:hypothetical protein
MKHRLCAVGAVSLLALGTLMAGCGDQGPVDLLITESLSLTLPPSLEAWPTEPGDGYWKDNRMDDGRDALLHVSPRGSDGSAARVETGWRVTPFPPPDARAACEVFLELVAVNMPSGAAGESSRAAAKKCVKDVRPGENVKRSWTITLEDGTPAQLSVTMRSLQDRGDYWVNIAAIEQ